jgi:hypothetical protein
MLGKDLAREVGRVWAIWIGWRSVLAQVLVRLLKWRLGHGCWYCTGPKRLLELVCKE